MEWFADVAPVICGAYRMTPAEVAEQTPGELQTMLEGLDWVSDREWERALYLRIEPRHANKLSKFSYPHFRTPRIVATFSSEDD